MDLGLLGVVNFDMQFYIVMLNIIFINIILSGDNAVLIAMAVRTLPRRQRMQGIIFGSGLAVILRIVLTFFVAQLLMVKFLKLAGGLLILYIAVQLLIEGVPDENTDKGAGNLWQAIKIIVIADITMSTDNVLAVAAAAGGSLFLLAFGLILSIPLVVFASNWLSNLMDRYPIIIYIGSAILGKVGGEMIITDPYIEGILHPSALVQYNVEGFFAVAVIVSGRLLLKWKSERNYKVAVRDLQEEES